MLHKHGAFTLSGAVSSTPNTKLLQPVRGVDDALHKLARHNYYKYRAATLMFGFNSNILSKLRTFCGFNALRKNQLLAFYEQLQPILRGCMTAAPTKKCRG